ncbi:MAG: Tfx family DNA-binding protein [Methanoculleaceae archaeon]
MKHGLLTDRQKQILKYRHQGMTQQQIADLIHTSKANVCTIEKAAYENIRRAKETLEFLYTLEAIPILTLHEGEDALDAAAKIYDEAEKRGIKVRYDTIALLSHMRTSMPKRFRGRYIKHDIDVYLSENGEVYFT